MSIGYGSQLPPSSLLVLNFTKSGIDHPFAKVAVCVKGACAKSSKFSSNRPCSTSTSMRSSAWMVKGLSSWKALGGVVKPGMPPCATSASGAGAGPAPSQTHTKPSFSLVGISFSPSLARCTHRTAPVSAQRVSTKSIENTSKVEGLSLVSVLENSTGCQNSLSSVGHVRSDLRSLVFSESRCCCASAGPGATLLVLAAR
mmetsp:Transcript_33475/g.72281  ORF Transcript_33475/g.72281 Transcript_33475/m.72281 type:complete len:200 (-) Transcript_33475:678-1277(-)